PAATQRALNLAFFVKLFCLAHASQAHPTKHSSDPPLLNATLLMRLALPSHEAKAIPPISRTKGFHKAQTTA
ncbi:hypothetical protein QTC65_001676, partial [Campylobacter upsaliensis]|nr:hypothetical protein [Campylobacter upsaliensis]